MAFAYPLKEPSFLFTVGAAVVHDADGKEVFTVKFGGEVTLKEAAGFAHRMAKEYEATFPGTMKLGEKL